MRYSNLVELLENNVTENPEQIAFTFLDYKEDKREETSLSLKQTYDGARRIAEELKERGVQKSDRVIIFSAQQKETPMAVYGSLFAGAVFCLVPPPVDLNKINRFQKIFADSEAKFVLCTADMEKILLESEQIDFIRGKCELVRIDNIKKDPEKWMMPDIEVDDLAYLQYSSGSTNFPKGVMISHKNLLHNIKSCSEMFDNECLETMISWVPLFHNMGLVFNVFFNIYNGCKSVILPTEDFMAKPLRWFEAMADFRARMTVGPNSAFTLCTKVVKDEELEGMDLSELKYAFNGSEPINPQILLDFVGKFEKAGLDPTIFSPAYGLAESTMLVTGSRAQVTCKTIDYEAFRRNKFVETSNQDKLSKQIVSVGKILNHTKALIVDPHTFEICNSNEIGELWLQSESVAQGYFKNKEQTESTFEATLVGHAGTFVRTGDLGIIVEDEFYITGRCKDLIIINGHNLYPLDIEVSLKENIEFLRLCTIATFPTLISEKERIVIAIELNQMTADLNHLTHQINHVIHQEFDLTPYEIIYVKPRELPRTDNGKIRLFKIKEAYEEGSLITSIINITGEKEGQERWGDIDPEILRQVSEIIREIINPIKELDIKESFFDLGGDSFDTVYLMSLLESTFEIEMTLKELLHDASICGISQYIENLRSKGEVLTDQTYLYEDSQLPDEIRPIRPLEGCFTTPKNIFLTGSTGFLGAYLIKDLMELTTATVYCHVRATNEAEGLSRLRENMMTYKCWDARYQERVKVVIGDLNEPLMGIEPKYFEILSETIDCIYHNGAVLNFLFPYSYLKQANVDGTIECLRLACQGKHKVFHYISSFSVYDQPKYFETIGYENQDMPEAQGYFLKYSETKWVAERLVKEAERRGLSAAIYRPGNISGDTVHGIWKMSDMITRMLIACIKRKSVPDIEMKLNLTPVDYVSEAIVRLSLQEVSKGNAFNLVNPKSTTFIDFYEMAKEIGYDLKLIDYSTWQQMLFQDTQENPLKILESLFKEDGNEETAMIRRYGDKGCKIDMTNTYKGLKQVELTCPAVDKQLIAKYLRYFEQSKYL